MGMPDSERERQALDWVRRIADPDFSAWDAHMRWLEEDPRNAPLFDRLSLEMEAATDGLEPAGPIPPAIPVANDNGVPARGRRWALGSAAGGLVAASVAALLLWPQPQAADGRLIVTAPGQVQNVELADGSRIALNGGGRMRIDGDRSVALLDGEAFFEVAHHADHPFRLQVGSRIVQDVGTAFDVARLDGATRIAVRDGAVAIDPEAGNVRLSAGQEARIDPGGQIIRTTVPQNHAIGGWREGRLVYQGATWTDVAIDLSRALGVPVSAGPAMADRRFTGVIVLDPDRERTIRRVADVAGVAARREGQGWLLAPR
jgi:transmembrane sensor